MQATQKRPQRADLDSCLVGAGSISDEPELDNEDDPRLRNSQELALPRGQLIHRFTSDVHSCHFDGIGNLLGCGAFLFAE